MSGKRKAPVDDQEAARELLRDLHAAIKDGKALLRQMQDVMGDLEVIAGEVFEERMDQQVKDGLEAYKAVIGRSIEEASQSVFKRFDTIHDMLMGEGPKDRDIPSVGELVTLYHSAVQYQIGQQVVEAAAAQGLTAHDVVNMPGDVKILPPATRKEKP